MSLATVLSWGGWFFVLWNIDPEQGGLLGFGMFYVTLFMGLVGTLALFGVTARVVLLKRKDVLLRHVRIAFRHGVLLSLVAISALALSGQGTLRWWSVPAMVVVMSFVEYLFLVGEESRR